MKSNTSILLSIAVAILGFIIIKVAGLALSADIAFAIGAIVAGLAIQFIKTGKSTSSASNNTATGDFATTTLYVGNLPYRANEMSIRTLFAEQGKVLSVRLMKDKHTGKRRGFGFVEMPEKDAQKAITALNEQNFQDRSLKVREANERAPRTESQQNVEV